MNMSTAAASLTLAPKAKYKALSKLYIHTRQRKGEVEADLLPLPAPPLSPSTSAHKLPPRLDSGPQHMIRYVQFALEDFGELALQLGAAVA